MNSKIFSIVSFPLLRRRLAHQEQPVAFARWTPTVQVHPCHRLWARSSPRWMINHRHRFIPQLIHRHATVLNNSIPILRWKHRASMISSLHPLHHHRPQHHQRPHQSISRLIVVRPFRYIHTWMSPFTALAMTHQHQLRSTPIITTTNTIIIRLIPTDVLSLYSLFSFWFSRLNCDFVCFSLLFLFYCVRDSICFVTDSPAIPIHIHQLSISLAQKKKRQPSKEKQLITLWTTHELGVCLFKRQNRSFTLVRSSIARIGWCCLCAIDFSSSDSIRVRIARFLSAFSSFCANVLLCYFSMNSIRRRSTTPAPLGDRRISSSSLSSSRVTWKTGQMTMTFKEKSRVFTSVAKAEKRGNSIEIHQSK